MKATLEFDLDDEEDRFSCAVNGIQWRQAVQRIDQFMRDKLKHGDLQCSSVDAMQMTRDELFKILEDEELNLWE